MAKYDYVYANSNFARFATRRINDTYKTFGENLAERWPGYMLCKEGFIRNNTDIVVNQD